MKKILFLTGDFTEDYEIMVPFQMLEMVGYEVHTVSPNKKKGDTIKTAIHDDEGDAIFSEKPGHKFVLNYTFDQINLSDYSGLILSGGRAPEHLRMNERVLEIVKYFFSKELPIAAICHGIQILTAADVVRGRKLTAFPTVKPEVTMAGGAYQEIEADGAYVDGNLVTAPGWDAHPKYISAFLKLLGAKIEL